MKRITILLAAALVGCTSMPTVQQIGTPQNFAKCGAADVGITWIGLMRNNLHEVNPITKRLTAKIFGGSAFSLANIPVAIGLYVATYYVLKWVDKPKVTAAATILACGTAVHNGYLAVTHAPAP